MSSRLSTLESLTLRVKIVFELKIRKVIDDWIIGRERMSVIELRVVWIHILQMEFSIFLQQSAYPEGLSPDNTNRWPWKMSQFHRKFSRRLAACSKFSAVHESQQQYLIIKCHTHFSFRIFHNEVFLSHFPLSLPTFKQLGRSSPQFVQFSSKFSNGEKSWKFNFLSFTLACCLLLPEMVDAHTKRWTEQKPPN